MKKNKILKLLSCFSITNMTSICLDTYYKHMKKGGKNDNFSINI